MNQNETLIRKSASRSMPRIFLIFSQRKVAKLNYANPDSYDRNPRFTGTGQKERIVSTEQNDPREIRVFFSVVFKANLGVVVVIRRTLMATQVLYRFFGYNFMDCFD
jgi:hypothetical protein